VRAVRVAAAVTCAALCIGVPARAELSQDGNLLTSFAGRLIPKRLPREAPGPVAVRVDGDVRTLNGAVLPQLRKISVAINSAGRLFDKGLPICRESEIQPAIQREAKRVCGGAIVGSGHVVLRVRIPEQPPFPVKAHLLAFNGPRRHGHKLILAQAYAREPPGSFVLPFVVRRKGGVFGTTMTTTLPAMARDWAYLTHFDMTLDRRYRYGGKMRSYVSAACAAPVGFRGATFPFAKATYSFDNGQKTTTSLTRTCLVR
jgi:hypothetical protein